MRVRKKIVIHWNELIFYSRPHFIWMATFEWMKHRMSVVTVKQPFWIWTRVVQQNRNLFVCDAIDWMDMMHTFTFQTVYKMVWCPCFEFTLHLQIHMSSLHSMGWEMWILKINYDASMSKTICTEKENQLHRIFYSILIYRARCERDSQKRRTE